MVSTAVKTAVGNIIFRPWVVWDSWDHNRETQIIAASYEREPIKQLRDELQAANDAERGDDVLRYIITEGLVINGRWV